MKLLPSRVIAWLGLILFVGLLARMPGLQWGYSFFGTEVVVLHHDELPYSYGHPPGSGYPRGLEVNVRLLTWILSALGIPAGVMRHYDLLIGRIPSLIYGLLTIIVVFRLARALFRDNGMGLLAGFFLSLADLHVTSSHLGIPDSAATFWFYAALASAHTGLERGSRPAFLISAVCTGAAAAMRYQAMSLIPLAWWVARSRARVLNGLLLLGTFLASFYLFNGFTGDPWVIWNFLTFHAGWGNLGFKKLFLPLVYLGVVLVGVGLPIFLLAGYGLFQFTRAKSTAVRGWRDLLADNQIPICLAPLGAFAQMSTVSLWAHRHAVVLVPFVAMMAAYGFAQLPRRALGRLPAQVTAGTLLVAIGIYLAIQVASVQANFVDDPLEKAGRWLRARVPAGETLSIFGARIPPEYPVIAEWEAPYLILSASEYRRYLFKDFLPVHLTDRFPSAHEIWGGNGGDATRLQKLFRGELPYWLRKTIRPRFYTPELLLTQALWYPPPHLGEVLIYERRREWQIDVELRTPSQSDYLLTLNTGGLWRLAPGQEVRLSLNGTALAVQLTEKVNHLILPRALISSPHSKLQLSSNLLLPHLPADFLKRIRPLRQEFVVHPSLDGDLMVEGFYQPEVGADGASWRWTRGAARVILPGRAGSGPWRVLAVRLGGRPSSPHAPQTVVFFLNGRRVGEALLSGEDRVSEFPIPTGLIDGDLAVLDIVTLPWQPSKLLGSRDTRELGVAVYWVRLTRAERVHDKAGTVGGRSGCRA